MSSHARVVVLWKSSLKLCEPSFRLIFDPAMGTIIAMSVKNSRGWHTPLIGSLGTPIFLSFFFRSRWLLDPIRWKKPSLSNERNNFRGVSDIRLRMRFVSFLLLILTFLVEMERYREFKDPFHPVCAYYINLPSPNLRFYLTDSSLEWRNLSLYLNGSGERGTRFITESVFTALEHAIRAIRIRGQPGYPRSYYYYLWDRERRRNNYGIYPTGKGYRTGIRYETLDIIVPGLVSWL